MFTPYSPTPTTVYAHILLVWAWKTNTTPDMLVEWQPSQRTSLPHRLVHSAATASTQIPPASLPLTIREASSPPSILKRHRVETDVDGEDSVEPKKKRRLRLDLVTSRLSQPYATPTTHIISRKFRRPGPWTKPQNRVRSPLRRAAILNAIRIRRAPAKNFGPRETNLLTGLKPQKELDHTEVDLVSQGVRTPRGPMPNGCSPQQYLPPPPSPLGPSNYYDALDEDDDPFEENESENSDDAETVYSNFNNIGGTDLDVEDYDTHSPFSGEEENCQPWIPSPFIDSLDLIGGTEQHLMSLTAPCSS
ncbi:MAG: hypothetical protein Q9207_000976 [Kuettlingeria erythrocarpa]